MLTLDELYRLSINESVAREAHSQVTKRLEDALATKSGHEQKAFALLAAYTTIALALFTAFAVLGADSVQHRVAPAFSIAGALYALGACLCGLALLPQNYGAVGSDPSVWLTPGVIDGEDSALSTVLAYEVSFHHQRIKESIQSNRRKALLIRIAIIAGGFGLGEMGAWLWLGS